MYALLRYHYGGQPEDYTDEELAQKWAELSFMLTYQRQYYKNLLHEVIAEAFGKKD
ncbi:hypothetical protein [Flexibacter flexilis]|uniref:hypothetical protein n=1 Tax=Flexibacter flexilis TaxID=998 RepID=UPI0015A565FB|nr:hypothetical protein [Flexibacter flexilis]